MEQTFPAESSTVQKTQSETYIQPVSSRRFDLLYSLLCIWFIFGMLIDSWAHTFNIANTRETFFTPWHAVLYTGFGAIAAMLGWVVLRNFRAAPSWKESVPRGYELSLLGIGMFGIGGIVDPLWHLIVGREVRLDILLSPTHLLLITAINLIISGPVRAEWRRDETSFSLQSGLPVLISTLLLLYVLSFPFIYNHPIQVYSSPARISTSFYLFGDILGSSGIIMHTAVLMGLILIMLRRWRLPFGIFTFLLGGMYVMVAPQHPTYGALLPLIIGMFLAGFLCDVLYRLVKPSYTELFKLRLFSFLMPVIVYSLYFASVGLFDGIGWTIHLVVGNIIISGLVGLAVALALTIAATPNLPTLQKP